MKNKELWKPTKYVFIDGKLRASRNPAEVGVGSVLITDMVANCYERYLPQFAKGRLIDLGCGSVPLYEAYRRYVSDNTCVDWKETAHPSCHLDEECDLNQRLPFADGSFDTILLSDVLEHVYQPMHLWNEMSRIAVRGGRVILNVAFYYGLHEAPHDYFRYTEHALRRMSADSGFSVVLLEPVGGIPDVIADLVSKRLGPTTWLRRPFATSVNRLVSRLRSTRLGQRISESSSKTYPFFYFMVAEKS
jgi:SAM-dependent methyltransferase